MQVQSLITRQAENDDRLGQILSVTTEEGRLCLNGILLRPMRIKDYIISNTTLERLRVPKTVELYNGNKDDDDSVKLLGAGTVELSGEPALGFGLYFNISLLDEEMIESVKNLVGKLGLTAFERLYPIMPIFEIKESELYCNICDEKKIDCAHETGKDYLRVTCRANVRGGSITSLAWAGVRELV
jgi:hypothetical protein